MRGKSTLAVVVARAQPPPRIGRRIRGGNDVVAPRRATDVRRQLDRIPEDGHDRAAVAALAEDLARTVEVDLHGRRIDTVIEDPALEPVVFDVTVLGVDLSGLRTARLREVAHDVRHV